MQKICLLATILAAGAWADCVPRKFTPAEEKIAAQVAETLKAAFAHAPQGWSDTLSEGAFRPGIACQGAPPSQTNYMTASLTYSILNPQERRQYPEEAALKRLQAERDALTRRPESVRQKINEIRARASEKMRASKAAERAGNQEEARRLRGEYEAISQEEQAVVREFEASIAPKLAEIDAKMAELRKSVPGYDTRTFVTIRVSADSSPSVPDPPPGKRLNEDVYVWKRAGAAPYPGAVSRVVLEIRGWPDYRETVTSRIDLARLAALVQ